jgi:acetyltransferase-like isoleucine patch superfamily enzyme
MQFHSFGARSICHKPFWIEGAPKIAIGEDVGLLGVWLGVVGKAWTDPDPAPRLRIGNGVAVLPYGRIIAFESVVIEDHVAIAAGCLIGDAEHTKASGWDSFAQGPLETAPTRIGRGTLLAERVTVLKGSNIGKGCFIGTNAVVQGTIPDYSIAIGTPARVVGRTRGAREPSGAPVTSSAAPGAGAPLGALGVDPDSRGQTT